VHSSGIVEYIGNIPSYIDQNKISLLYSLEMIKYKADSGNVGYFKFFFRYKYL
jgi:hypothetical protein